MSAVAKLLLAWLAGFAVLLVAGLTGWCDFDEFIFLNNAKRVAEGQVQGRDFFQFIMPGWMLVTAALFKLFGPSLLAARALVAALVAAGAVLSWRLARGLGAGPWLAPLPALYLVFAMHAPRLVFTHRAFAQAATALTLWLAFRALAREDERAWGLVGMGVGLTYAVHQQDGAVLGVGLALGALWLAWRERWEPRSLARRAGWYACGALAPLGLMAAWFAAQGTLAEVLWQTHVWTLTQYRAPGNHNDVAYATDLWAIVQPWPWAGRVHFYGRLPLVCFNVLVPPLAALAGLAWLAGLGRAGALAAHQRLLAPLAFVVALGFLAALRARTDVAHLVGGILPAVLLVTVAIAGWERLLADTPARGLRWLPRVGVLVAIALAPVVALQGARHLQPSRIPAFQSPDARLTSHPSFAAVAARLGPGDTLFTSAQAAVYNFYLAPNPTRYDYWVPASDGYTTAEQHRELMADVRARRSRLALVAAETRARADAILGELAADYRLIEVLPHPSAGGRAPLLLHLYEARRW